MNDHKNPSNTDKADTSTITWVLFAGGHLAQLYRVEDSRWINASKLADFEHPESRMHAPDLVTDDLGRRRDGGNERGAAVPQRSKMDPKLPLKDQQKLAFVHEILDYLEAAHHAGHFDELVVFAPPSLLGMLREAISKRLAQKVIKSVGKDLTFVREHDAGQRLHREMHEGEDPGEPYSTGSADGRLRNVKRK